MELFDGKKFVMVKSRWRVEVVANFLVKTVYWWLYFGVWQILSANTNLSLTFNFWCC